MLKTNKSLKLPPVDMKATSSILYEIRDGRMAQNNQKCLVFIVVPRVRVKNSN